MNGLRIVFLFLCLQMIQGCFRSGFTSDRGELIGSGSDTSNSVEDEPVTEAPAVGNDGNNEPVTDDQGNNVNDETPTLPGCPSIIARSQWGARAAKSSTTPMTSTPMFVIIHHGTGTRCFTPEKCQEIVRDYQNLHMDTRKWADIGYNFIVGEDGNVYEGRGWGITGAHAGKGLNEKSLGICVIGDFSNNVPNEAALNAMKQLITCSKSNDKLLSTYTIRAHRNTGQKLCDVIKTWPRYSESESVDADTTEDGTVSVDNAEIKLSECPKIISRSGWGARAPRKSSPMRSLPSYVIIHHGDGNGCHTKSACTSKVKGYQNYHMDDKSRNYDDIGYNFIVGEDGNVYEGRGWGIIGSHASPYNSKSLGICVIGNFIDSVPNEAAQTAIKQLISCSVANKKLAPAYKLKGHHDVKPSTECPGLSFYNVIKTWNNY